MTTFYTADHHFNHGKIIRMATRPFRNLEHMNREMIRRWNDRVGIDDVIYHLGDFSFGPVADAHEIWKLLNGKKHLIVGNHDKASVKDWGWVSVSETRIVEDAGTRIFLSHYPTAEWPGFYRGATHFFGHVHGNRSVPGAMDVGVDLWGFAPVTAAEAIAAIGEREARRVRKTVLDFGGEVTRELVERADRWMAPWEREHLATAIDEAASAAFDDLLRQRVDQAGGRGQ